MPFIIFAYLPYAVHYTATYLMTCCIRKHCSLPFYILSSSIRRYAEAKYSNRVCIAGKRRESFENRLIRSISLFVGQIETGIPCTDARRNSLISEEIRNLLRSNKPRFSYSAHLHFLVAYWTEIVDRRESDLPPRRDISSHQN